MPIQYDIDGRMRPFGATEIVILDAKATDAALPADAESSGVTITTSNGLKSLSFVTGAVSGNAAYLRTPIVNNSAYTAIRVDLFGFEVDNTNVAIRLGVESTTVAEMKAVLRQDSSTGDSSGVILMGSETATQSRLNVRINSENTRKKNLSLLLIRRTNETYVLLNDGIYGYFKASTYNGSGAANVQPGFSITTRTAAAVTAKCLRMKITGWR